ncbi:hypothetical protein A2863_02950 [Candidatus Woesebacteria bacterium RIFCSPHIGHO2_01_FULL_38_9b]|uniref:Four helix bundle protein n=1 Tax=Candidatus Woesebacteria bacterium RIFCSPHIGHO2_01_FULL_38_9b TaxID=1802493 RepID=A0A1F7Y594_9BACT|nr:MAG: hypothetical protein A2863_02950 [Candidatus Woesebacteria bacterium RIFCSPHIGHO2_01_FULL_38_9b]
MDVNKKNFEDIHKRIYRFVIRVLIFLKKLPDTSENKVIRYQLAKSATSMGANDQEADGTTSVKDFINKYTIVRKESEETNYWLNVIKDTNPDITKEIDEFIDESLELIKIVSKIIYNSKNKVRK